MYIKAHFLAFKYIGDMMLAQVFVDQHSLGHVVILPASFHRSLILFPKFKFLVNLGPM